MEILRGISVLLIFYGILTFWFFASVATADTIRDNTPKFRHKKTITMILGFVVSPLMVVLFILEASVLVVFFAGVILIAWINCKLNYRLYRIDV